MRISDWSSDVCSSDLDYSEEDFRRTLTEETTIVFLLCKAARPHMVERKNISIVNIASASAHQPNMAVPGIAHTAAKGAVWSMTRQQIGRAACRERVCQYV